MITFGRNIRVGFKTGKIEIFVRWTNTKVVNMITKMENLRKI